MAPNFSNREVASKASSMLHQTNKFLLKVKAQETLNRQVFLWLRVATSAVTSPASVTDLKCIYTFIISIII